VSSTARILSRPNGTCKRSPFCFFGRLCPAKASPLTLRSPPGAKKRTNPPFLTVPCPTGLVAGSAGARPFFRGCRVAGVAAACRNPRKPLRSPRAGFTLATKPAQSSCCAPCSLGAMRAAGRKRPPFWHGLHHGPLARYPGAQPAGAGNRRKRRRGHDEPVKRCRWEGCLLLGIALFV